MHLRKIGVGIVSLSVFAAGIARCGDLPKGPEALRIYPGPKVQEAPDDTTRWIQYDDGEPQYYFPLPDEWEDQYFNVRFEAPDSCKLLRAAFFFTQVPELTDSLPDIKVLVWNSTGLFPDSTLDSLVLYADSGDIHLYPDTTLVIMDTFDLPNFSAGEKFHIGWNPVDSINSSDTLAILTDDGIPETNYSCEWWGEDVQAWGTIQSHWGIGINFFIRALVEILEDTTAWVWLEPDRPSDFGLVSLYPNPFNPEATLVIHLKTPQEVSLEVYDLTGRLVQEITRGSFPAGETLVRWQPSGLTSGSYFVMMKSADKVSATRATLLK